jgi:hypothetical protein
MSRMDLEQACSGQIILGGNMLQMRLTILIL